MNKYFFRRTLAFLMAFILSFGSFSSVIAVTPSDDIQIELTDNSSVSAKPPIALSEAETDSGISTFSLPNASDTVRVSILLSEKSTIEVADEHGISLAEITSDDIATDYRRDLENRQDEVARIISEKVLDGEPLDVVWNLTLATNIISANLPYDKIEDVKNLSEVEDVIIETMYEPFETVDNSNVEPLMSASSSQIGSQTAWTSNITGAGTRIAVIDTGTDYNHQSFNDDAYLYALQKRGYNIDELNLLDIEEIRSVFNDLHIAKDTPNLNPDVLYFSHKLPFCFNYASKNTNVDHSDGEDEHGSHVAGIATANSYIKVNNNTYVDALEETGVCGVAPEAQLITMRVFQNGNSYDGNYMAAIEDALVLGCDSVNLSLGSPAPGFSTNSTYQKLLDGLSEKGAVVVIAAGNSYQWPYLNGNGTEMLYSDGVNMQTLGSPASYTNSLAVSSVNSLALDNECFNANGHLTYYMEVIKDEYPNLPLTTLPNTDYDYIIFDSYAYENGTNVLMKYSEQIKNKILFCSRGGDQTSIFSMKANSSVEAGAIATVIYNNQAGDLPLNMSKYKYKNPCVSITKSDIEIIKNASEKHTFDDGTVYYTGTLTIGNDTKSDLSRQRMSTFSSWGAPGSLELKPEISAPGGGIYSVNGAVSGNHTSYEVLDGTSMASPQVAGMSALLAQYIKENNLTDKTNKSTRTLIQSLLMSTAIPLKCDGNNYYPVIQQGAGAANIANAVSADSYILMDSKSTKSYADGKVKAELGDDPKREGKYTIAFTVSNLTDKSKCYDLSADLFTQALSADKKYMSAQTTPLAQTAEWKINGEKVSIDSKNENFKQYDFNGDGNIDKPDADILMDYVIGKTTTLNSDTTPDVNNDNDVNTYDVYSLLQMQNTIYEGLVLPPNGSAQVEVTLSLTDSQKDKLNNEYPKGAYVQGFVFVNGISDAEGEKTTNHSIPVLGFYGNWSDSSMYEIATVKDEDYGKRVPYASKDGKTNHLIINYEDTGSTSYIYGGNPVVKDEKYMPERNAIAPKNGSIFTSWKFTPIRNFANARASIRYTDGTSHWKTADNKFAPTFSTFYHFPYRSWSQVDRFLPLSAVNLQNADDNSEMVFSMTLAPEYYVNPDGSVRWEELGEGATRSVSFTIDNEMPQLVFDSIKYDKTQNSISLKATDNQYVAGVFLYDEDGKNEICSVGANPSDKKGEGGTFTLKLPDEITNNKFQVRVYDYARNLSTYKIYTDIDLDTSSLSDVIAFDESTRKWVGFDKAGDTENTVSEYPRATDNFIASTMADGYIFAITLDKTLCVMPQSNPQSITLVNTVPTDIIDMTYDKAGGAIYALSADGHIYRVDRLTGNFSNCGSIDIVADTIACDNNGNLYCTEKTDAPSNSVKVYFLNQNQYSYSATFLTTVSSENTLVPISMDYDRDKKKLLLLARNITDSTEYDSLIAIDAKANGATEIVKSFSDAENFYELSCFALTDADPDNEWATPTDKIQNIKVIPSGIDIAIGGSVQFKAIVQPWNVRNPSITWLSNSRVKVTETGLATGVSEGTGYVTAASVADPEKYTISTIRVTNNNGIVHGVFRNAQTNINGLYSHRLDSSDGELENVIEIAPLPNSVSYCEDNNTLYLLTSDNKMCEIDTQTGNILSGPYDDILPMSSFICSKMHYFDDGSPYIYGVNGTTLYVGKNPKNLKDSGYAFPLYNNGFHSNFIAIASMGQTKHTTNTGAVVDAEKIALLDTTGKIWLFACTENNTYPIVDKSYTVDGAKFNSGVSYCSMIYAPDGCFYVSTSGWNLYDIYNKSTKIYKLNLQGTTAKATLMTTIDDISPGSIYGISYNLSNAKTSNMSAEFDEMSLGDNTLYNSDNTSNSENGHSLWAKDNSAPNLIPSLKSNDSTINMDIMALDKTGARVASHNGKFTITYDPDVLSFKNLTSNSSVFSFQENTRGTIVAGYADLNTVSADTAVAKLIFERKESDSSTVTITHNERNNIVSDYAEALDIPEQPKPTDTPTPTATPTVVPTSKPTATPTAVPTSTPTVAPTDTPISTATPTVIPTVTPTATPTVTPTATPTVTPTATPTATSTSTPTVMPTSTPTVVPTDTPISTDNPTVIPTEAPSPTSNPNLPNVEVATDGKMTTYKVTYEHADNNCDVYVALYDSDNRLVGVKRETYGTDVLFENTAVSSTRVFIWTKDFKPISLPKIIH